MAIGLGGGSACNHAPEAGQELGRMIGLNLITSDQVIRTLAADTVNGSPEVLAVVGRDLFEAMPSAVAVAGIGTLVASHAISEDQGVAILASYAAAGGTPAQMAAGNEVATLIAQGSIDATQAMTDIGHAVFTTLSTPIRPY